MADEKITPGCGWTQEQLIGELFAQSAANYEESLMRLGFKPTKRQTLVDGFRDGQRAALRHLEGMGVLVVIPVGQTVIFAGEE
jgi:hypothetical protein